MTEGSLQAALEETLRRIHLHQRHASEGVSRILDVLGERLCDHDFAGEELKSLCPPDSDTYRQFLLEIGFKPAVYLDQRRFDFARHLVCRSGVRIDVIAKSLGFRKAKYFGKWFGRRAGMAPKKLRAAQQNPRADESREPMTLTQKSWALTRIWHRCLLNCATPEEAASLILTLRGAYPGAARGGSGPDTAEEVGK